MTEPVLSAIYDFKNLVLNTAQNQAYETTHLIPSPEKMVDDNVLLGIEIEVENMKKILPIVEFYWNVKDDNSLRNNGLEFTSTPLRAKQIEYALNYYNTVVTAGNKPDYSNRTSVHVHMNVRDLTLDQIKNFVVLYALFEKHFFHIAGTKRENSIFCVPLYKTTPTGNISNLENNFQYWHKYSALNLGTVIGSNGLPMYGTIEFRHLYGTGDKKIIIDWINNILALRKEALQWKFHDLMEYVKTLNTTSDYINLYQRVFGDMVMLNKMEKYDFESCVSFVKTWEWGHKLRNKYQVRTNSCYHNKYKLAIEETEQEQEKPNLNIEKQFYYNGAQLKDLSSYKMESYADVNGKVKIKNVTEGWEATFIHIDDHTPINFVAHPFNIFATDQLPQFNLIYIQSAKYGTICIRRDQAVKAGLHIVMKYVKKPQIKITLPKMDAQHWEVDFNMWKTAEAVKMNNQQAQQPTTQQIDQLTAQEIAKTKHEEWLKTINTPTKVAKKPVTKAKKVKKPTLLNKLLDELE